MNMAQTSASFDSTNVARFLRRLMPLIANGFKMHDVARVERMLGRMKADQTCQIRFPVRYHGRDVELVIRAFMDDVAAPDMEFDTDDDLCSEIRSEFERFFEERGL